MGTPCFILMVCGSATALAQMTVVVAQPTLRTDPPALGLERRFTPGWGASSTAKGRLSTRRYVVDSANHIYFGYELPLEDRQKGTYLATFVKLAPTPMELSTGRLPGIPGPAVDLGMWTNQPLPAIPAPRQVHDGDTISIDLFVDAATGAKLIDDIRLQTRSVRIPPPPPPPPPPRVN